MSLAELDNALLAAHDRAANNPSQVVQLVDLYRKAYSLTLEKNETAAYFYLTNAYVYALDTDHPKCSEIELLLIESGRL